MKTILNGSYMRLMEETLSDGSKVYNVETLNGRTICLAALTEDEAVKVFEYLNAKVSSVL